MSRQIQKSAVEGGGDDMVLASWCCSYDHSFHARATCESRWRRNNGRGYKGSMVGAAVGSNAGPLIAATQMFTIKDGTERRALHAALAFLPRSHDLVQSIMSRSRSHLLVSRVTMSARAYCWRTILGSVQASIRAGEAHVHSNRVATAVVPRGVLRTLASDLIRDQPGPTCL